MTIESKVSTFGLKEVAVKLPADTSWVLVPSVTAATFKATVAEVEQWGDDTLQDVWRHSPKGQIIVKANQMAMAVFQKLSGSTATSNGSYEKLNIMPDTELDPPFISIRAKIRSRDTGGGESYVYGYWYKTTVKTVWESFPDGAVQKLGEVTFTFDCLRSAVDENNATLTTACFGRIEMPNNV